MVHLRTAILLGLLAIHSALLYGQNATGPRSIDVEHSTMTVHVSKAGLFKFAGDNHEIRAPISSGSVDERKRTVEIVVDARKMKVLDPHLSDSKRAQVQEKMLSPDVLDPERYPEIKFQSTDVQPKGQDGLAVKGNLTLHGRTRPVIVNVTGNESRYRGKTTVKQTEFGMKPVTVGGGTVKVKDEVEIEFEIVVR
jgi:polyisoprenoid-binding protein YceI